MVLLQCSPNAAAAVGFHGEVHTVLPYTATRDQASTSVMHMRSALSVLSHYIIIIHKMWCEKR